MKINQIVQLLTLLFIYSCGGGDGYTISGTVSGLDGVLVLQNNGKDDLTIEADGKFTFKTTLENEKLFDVKVKTEPCPQSCKIENGTGEVKSRDIENVKINCLVKTWSEPENFSSQIPWTTYLFVQDAFLGPQENAIVIWSGDGGSGTYYKSEYRDGRWIHPEKDDPIGISSSSISSVSSPKVVMNENGDAVLGWLQDNGFGTRSIYLSQYKYGFWDSPTLLSDTVSTDGIEGDSFDIGYNNLDDIVVSWIGNSNGVSDLQGVYKREYRDGKWSESPTQENHINVGSTEAYSVKVKINDSGDTIIGWTQTDGTDINLYKSEYYDQKWHGPSSLSDHLNPASDSTDKQFFLEMNNRGDAIFLWNHVMGTSKWDITMAQRQKYEWTVSDLNEIFPSANVSYSKSYRSASALALADNGDAIFSWLTDVDDVRKIYISEKRSGKWDWPVSIDDFIMENDLLSTSVTSINLDGSSNVLWIKDNNSTYELLSRRYEENYKRLPEVVGFKKGNPTVFEAEAEPIVATNNCKLLITWQNGSTFGATTYVSRYR